MGYLVVLGNVSVGVFVVTGKVYVSIVGDFFDFYYDGVTVLVRVFLLDLVGGFFGEISVMGAVYFVYLGASVFLVVFVVT